MSDHCERHSAVPRSNRGRGDPRAARRCAAVRGGDPRTDRERCGEFPDLRPRASFAAAESPQTQSPPAAMSADHRPRVLMIDDSTSERDLYALMLERDVQVLTASRGSEGIALAQVERPDAI